MPPVSWLKQKFHLHDVIRMPEGLTFSRTITRDPILRKNIPVSFGKPVWVTKAVNPEAGQPVLDGRAFQIREILPYESATSSLDSHYVILAAEVMKTPQGWRDKPGDLTLYAMQHFVRNAEVLSRTLKPALHPGERQAFFVRSQQAGRQARRM